MVTDFMGDQDRTETQTVQLESLLFFFYLVPNIVGTQEMFAS